MQGTLPMQLLLLWEIPFESLWPAVEVALETGYTQLRGADAA